MNPVLSLIMPAIRKHKWRALYDSIVGSWSSTFELILIGPYEPDVDVMSLPGVKYVKDWGSPTRAQHLGFLNSSGDYIGFALDDGLFVPGSLDSLFLRLNAPRTAVTGMFYEGAEAPFMAQEGYYYLRYHPVFNGLVIPHHYLHMTGPYFIDRAHVEAIGGWDCRFETLGISYVDFAVRLQNSGIRVNLVNGVVVKFEHMPGDSGDHAPMYHAHDDNDIPLFKKLYATEDGLKRTKVEPDNWKQSPAKWVRRFGK